MKFGTWNMKSLYRPGSLTAVARELVRCRLDLEGTGLVHTGVWWGSLRERGHLEDISVDWRIILKRIVKTWDEETWAELIWLLIETVSGRL
jgi:hypothetical protein